MITSKLFFFTVFTILSIERDELATSYLLEKTQNDSLKVTALIEESEKLIFSNPQKALQIAYNAVQISEESQNEYLLFSSKIQIGKLFFYKGIYESATQYFIEALAIAERVKNLEWKGKVYYRLGTIRLIMEDYREATEHFNRSEKFFEEYYLNLGGIKNIDKINFCNVYGLISSNTNKSEDAIRYYNLGLDIIGEDTSYLKNKIQILNNLGDLYFKINDYSLAIEAYNKGLSLLNKNENVLFEAMILNNIGKVNYKIDLAEKAIEYYKLAYIAASKVGGISHLKHITEGLGKSYEKLNLIDSALYYIQLSKVYEDTLNLRKTSERILQEELATKFKQEKIIISSTFSKKQNLLFIIIAFLVFISIIFYFINKIQKIKHNKIRNINNERINISEKERVILKNKVVENNKKMTLILMKNIKKDALIDLLSKKTPISDENINKIKQNLNDIKNNKELQNFEYQFERIYIGFFEKLQNEYPELTANQRRLCAFLKLQMNSKEIANVTGQTLRAVEMARIRLRKKLGITNADTSLNDFFKEY